LKPKILIIVGPTSSGKKKLSLKAAQRFGGEIVNADSRKVYRYMDIGTAKPSLETRKQIPHHLIDIVDPDEPFSAGEWAKRASVTVEKIITRGMLPIISGGTGFYIRAFRDGLTEGITPDPEVRKRLEHELASNGAIAMYRKLAAIDPERASELHEQDTFRVMRALEIYHSSGRTFTDIRQDLKVTGGDYDYFTIGISMSRSKLYERINERVDTMVSQGLVDEVKSILEKGYSRELPALDTVGYREWFPFFDGSETFEYCMDSVKQDTRRYAKRQLTWFRAEVDVQWFDALVSGEPGKKLNEVETWLNT